MIYKSRSSTYVYKRLVAQRCLASAHRFPLFEPSLFQGQEEKDTLINSLSSTAVRTQIYGRGLHTLEAGQLAGV